MDSLTQFVLGAGVGAAVLGRRVGSRRAVLIGGVLGTLPDLDFLIPTRGDLDSYVSHRGPTHSLFAQALATPVIGELLVRAFRPLRDARMQVWLAVYLCLATHALLDSLTIYGTRLLWPLSPDPIGLGSLFIIDPLYTLPLLVATAWGLLLRHWTAGVARAVTVALALSSGYIVWSVAAQQVAEARGRDWLRAHGVTEATLYATPAPFSTLLWRVMAIDGARNFNVYVPLLGGADTVTGYQFVRWPGEVACWIRDSLRGDTPLRVLSDFTDGFYQIELVDGSVVVADLRMGLAPRYAFRFAVADLGSEGVTAIAPERRRSDRASPGDYEWLVAGIAGHRVLRPAERNHAIQEGKAALPPSVPSGC